MTISMAMRQFGIVATFVVFVGAAVFSGCKPSEKPTAKPQPPVEKKETKAPSDAENNEKLKGEESQAAKSEGETQKSAESKSSQGAEKAAPTESQPAGKEKPAAKSAESPRPKKSTYAPKDITKTLPYTVQPFDPTLWADANKPPKDAKKPDDLEKPLVDQPGALVRLDPKELVWVDKKNREVVLQGFVCAADTPLEFFATYANRAYESVLTINVKPSTIHAALLAVGAEPGHPAQFIPPKPPKTDGEFVPPMGTEIAVEVRWRDKEGKVFSAPAQYWVRNVKTKDELDCNWVFAGSQFMTDEATGKRYYQADSGEMICLLSLTNAMLDLPRRGYGALEARSFESFKEHMPPDGTPVTVFLKPVLPKKMVTRLSDADIAAAQLSATRAGEIWLAYLDHGQYSKCWEEASGYLKGAVERRDFIKQLSGVVAPFGTASSRKIVSRKYETTLPGAPDGHYFVLQYKTAFAKKAAAVETLTLTLSKDKQWRVIGYFAK